MNSSFTTASAKSTTAIAERSTVESVQAHVLPSVRPSLPTIAEMAAAICADAQHDSLKYVLRSNTWHDGE